MKTAIIILSDPKSGTDEALGRVFNALTTALGARQAGDEVEIVFSGAGTRWPTELAKLAHPAHGLFQSLRDLVKGASCGCAAVFGATKEVEACGLPLIATLAVPGLPGVSDTHAYLAGGWRTLVF
jgi:predicted peroxiredoxin